MYEVQSSSEFMVSRLPQSVLEVQTPVVKRIYFTSHCERKEETRSKAQLTFMTLSILNTEDEKYQKKIFLP